MDKRKILSKEKINQALSDHYIKNYGERDSDFWYEQPAVNMWNFKRDNRIIYLKCHVLTGKVTEQIEEV